MESYEKITQQYLLHRDSKADTFHVNEEKLKHKSMNYILTCSKILSMMHYAATISLKAQCYNSLKLIML